MYIHIYIVKEDKANKQHRSIIEALRAAAPEWTFEQINFVAERHGAAVEDGLLKWTASVI